MQFSFQGGSCHPFGGFRPGGAHPQRVFEERSLGDYDNGRISDEEVLRAILPTLPTEDREEGARYFEDFINHFTPFDGMEDLLKELKGKGYSLYLVSDFPHKFLKLWDRFSLFRLFDGRAVSFEAKGSKRDLRLFDYVLKTYGLDPSECLFVDDVAHLVANAGTYGIDGHVFCGVEDLRAYLKQRSLL